MLHEVPVREILGVSVSPQLTLDLPGVRVFEDGSADQGSGIAAGCLVSGMYLSSRASLALPGMTGSAASELLGVILGLMVVREHFGEFGRYQLMVDSQGVLEYVFQDKDPVDRSGRDLLPGIMLARELLMRLRRKGVSVYAEKVMSCQNLAHVIAYQEQSHRRGRGWRVEDDEWTYPLRDSFKEVFQVMVWNRTHHHLVAPPFCLGDVLSADLSAIF